MPAKATTYKSVTENLKSAEPELKQLFQSLKDYLLALGDDVQERTLKFYFAFTRIKNFCCVEIRPSAGEILAYVKVDPSSLKLEDGFTKDMTDIGHHGTGDLQIRLSTKSDLERAKSLFKRSYDQS